MERLCQAYEAAELKVPRDFAKQNYVLPASGIASHTEGGLKKRGYVPDTSSFASWRKQQEEEHRAEQASGGCDPPPSKTSRKK